MNRLVRGLGIGAVLMSASGWMAQAHAAAGRTAGVFAVSSTGAATYSIPLWTPPGPRGIQPKLALVYNSQSGDGPLGVGWSLAGLGAITRCNQTRAQDGAYAAVTLTYSDRFCLNGNRLRLSSSENLSTYGQDGTTYQTEIADFSNVTAHGTQGSGPAYFTVQGRDGLTYQYGYIDPSGNGANSQVLASGSATAFMWLLSRISDRAGNTLIVNYDAGTGSASPATILWTAASAGASTYVDTMTFTYGVNVPQGSTAGYVAGTPVNNTDLLASITISSAGSTVKKYVLAYQASATTGRNELITVQECADTGATNCLLPTTIGYQAGAAGVTSTATTAAASATVLFTHYDLNGDGIRDLVYSTGSAVYVQFGSPSGFGAPINTGLTAISAVADLLGNGKNGIIAPNGATAWYYTWNGSGFTGVPTGLAPSEFQTLTDINGDGLPDLVELQNQPVGPSGGFQVFTRINTSAGGTVSFSATLTSALSSSCPYCYATLWRPDLEGSGSLTTWDFNGDGLQDIALMITWYTFTNSPQPRVQHALGEFLSNGTTFTFNVGMQIGPTTVGYAAVPQFVHWNDDACTDVIWNNTIYIAGCNGTAPVTIPVTGGVLTTLDWDGDGRTDVLAINNGTIGVYRSTGTGISAFQPTSIPWQPVAACTYFAADLTGDGLDDLGCWEQSGAKPVSYYLHNGSGQPPDLMASIADGYGNAVTPSYVALTQSDHYAKYADALPGSGYIDYIAPIYVVSQAAFSDPSSTSGATYQRAFWYAGAWMNVQGRGFAGFASTQSTDSRTGYWDRRDYNRAFPYTGRLVNEYLSQQPAAAVPITALGNSLAVATLDGTANNQRYFPYVAWSIQQSYEVGGNKNGQLIKTVGTNHGTPDAYGNFPSVSVTTTDNDAGSPYVNQVWSTTTATSVTPDTSGNWCLALPTQVQVTNSAPGTPAITRTVAYIPDYAACRETQQITEPGNGLYQVTEGFAFDAFGNIATDTVTGIGMNTRVTSATWDATGRFPAAITNALGQTTSMGFDPVFGGLTRQTDPNGVTTDWSYDAFGRRTQETRPDGTALTWVYNDCTGAGGCLIGSHGMAVSHYLYNVDGTVQTDGTTYYDPADRPLAASVMALSGTAYSRNEVRYDSRGRVTQQAIPCTWVATTTPCPYWTTNHYDGRNRLTQSQRPQSATQNALQSTSIDYEGDTTITTDPEGHATTHIATAVGTLGRSQDANGYYQSFGYDALGSLTAVTDSLSHTLFTASYAYGLQAFQTGTTDTDLGSWGYSYDALGERTHWTDAKCQQFSAQYDALARMVQRNEPDLVSTWTWGTQASLHNIGKLQYSSAGSYSEGFGYDTLGRLQNHSISADTSYVYDYAYNANTGLLDTLTYPTSTSSYRFALHYGYQGGMLHQITDNQNGSVYWTANAADARNQVTQETLGNGVVVNRALDAVTGWPSAITAGAGGGAALQNQSYLYDLMGNLIQRQDNNLGLTENAYYDTMYRLDHTTRNGSSSWDLEVKYDVMGNITFKNDVDSPDWTYDPTHVHQVLTAGTYRSYHYDANGNMSVRNGNPIGWTSYNYPRQITQYWPDAETESFSYDANRQRYRQVFSSASAGTETTYYIGGLLEKTLLPSGVVDWRHYVYAGSEPVAIISRQSSGTNAVHYVLEDPQGSTAAFVDGSANTTVKESFRPFGLGRNPQTWSGDISSADISAIDSVSRRGFGFHTTLGVPGVFNTAMDLIHMNGRVMDDTIGRFLSPDPYVQDPGNTQSFNRYSYVLNNPLSYTDPSGFCWNSWDSYLRSIGQPDATTPEDQPAEDTNNWAYLMGQCGIPTIGTVTGTTPPPDPPPPWQPPGDTWPPSPTQPPANQNPGGGGGGGGNGGSAVPGTPTTTPKTKQCNAALRTARQNQAALTRARSHWSSIASAAAAHGIDPALLAAIGVRETGFRNVWESGPGWGAGVFQIDLSANPGVTNAQAFNVGFSANYAAGVLAGNRSVLAAEFPDFTPEKLIQATAASYNLGVGGISGNPATIDVGSAGSNYGSNVLGLMQCFK